MKNKNLRLTAKIDELAALENYFAGGSNISNLHEYKNMVCRIINNELTKRQRDCITLRFYKNLSAEEISNTLGIDKATVYKHIRTGIKNIKKYMEIYLNVYFKPQCK